MSSLFAALGVSVSGLNAQSQAIGNISDNLANAQTTGFKEIGTSFTDLVTVSNATANNPGGVTAKPQYENDVQGNITTTATTSNLAISGQGFFAVESAVQTTSGTTQFTGSTFYTRQGDFTLNKDGYLVNSSGYYLLGYAVDPTTGTVNSSQTTEVQISSLLDNPVPTSRVSYAANLPSGATAGSYTSTSSTVQVYDALGNTHQLSLTWSKVGTNDWRVAVDVVGGASNGAADYTATIPVEFNSNSPAGTIETISAGTGYTVNSGTSADVTFSLSFPGVGAQSVDLNLGTYNAAEGVTQYADTNTAVAVTSFQQNGLGKGSFSSVDINNSGIVSINYSNGSTRQIYQIPIVNFNSPDNLQRLTGGAYQATLASGTANVYVAGTNGAGTISSGSLESSNVDIATEFTQMIQSQQIYSANAKTVTTINQMLNTIIQAVQ